MSQPARTLSCSEEGSGLERAIRLHSRDVLCGIYATNDPDELRRSHPWMLESETFVLGRVALWGKVIAHEQGFCAEKAYPTEFLVPRNDDDPRLAEAMARALAPYAVRSVRAVVMCTAFVTMIAANVTCVALESRML